MPELQDPPGLFDLQRYVGELEQGRGFAGELADVLINLCAIANRVGTDLEQASRLGCW